MRKDFIPAFSVNFYPAKGGQGYLNLFDNFKNSSLALQNNLNSYLFH
jgi:hypothetical protein